MAVQNISRSFKDIDLSFEPNPVTGDLAIIKNEGAIRRSVRNLVETNKFERFFNPTIGSNIGDLLFDFVDIGSAAAVRKEVELAISNYEPRVENVQVDVEPLPDENSFNITVVFDIIGQSTPTQTFSFILEATR